LSNQRKKKRERLCECCEALFQTTTKKAKQRNHSKNEKKDVSLVTNKEKKSPQARMFGCLTSLACSNKHLKQKQENDQKERNKTKKVWTKGKGEKKVVRNKKKRKKEFCDVFKFT
jgi:hypothetical protein